MHFNVKKCKVMHLGRKNNKFDYKMAGQKLEKTKEKNDLGVIICDNLKIAAQCAKAAKTAVCAGTNLVRVSVQRQNGVYAAV
jgi:hypothetical protein